MRNIIVSLGLDAFVDNTNLIYGLENPHTFNQIVQNMQANLDLWHGLLQASGGTLSPSKCSWTPFYWNMDNNGTETICMPPANISISTVDCQGSTHQLKPNKPSVAVQLLGVHIAADGNPKKELLVLKQ